MSCSIVMTGTPSRSPSSMSPGSRIIDPSSATTSAIAPTGFRPGEAHELDGGLGVAAALAHAAVDGAQRQDVTRPDDARRRRGRVGEHVEGVRAVGRR